MPFIFKGTLLQLSEYMQPCMNGYIPILHQFNRGLVPLTLDVCFHAFYYIFIDLSLGTFLLSVYQTAINLLAFVRKYNAGEEVCGILQEFIWIPAKGLARICGSSSIEY